MYKIHSQSHHDMDKAYTPYFDYTKMVEKMDQIVAGQRIATNNKFDGWKFAGNVAHKAEEVDRRLGIAVQKHYSALNVEPIDGGMRVKVFRHWEGASIQRFHVLEFKYGSAEVGAGVLKLTAMRDRGDSINGSHSETSLSQEHEAAMMAARWELVASDRYNVQKVGEGFFQGVRDYLNTTGSGAHGYSVVGPRPT